MPRTDPNVVTRHLDAEEREIRRLYLLEHPEDDLRLAPTTAGFAEIADWWAERQAPVLEETPSVVAEPALRPHGAVSGG